MKVRKVTKRIIKNIFVILVLPVYLVFEIFCVLGTSDGTFQSFSQALSLIPGKIGIYARAAFYRLACPNTSDEVSIGFLSVLSHRDTTISQGVYIGPHSNVGKCSLGANTLLGSGVHILSGKHQHNFSDHEKPIQEQGGAYEKITIGEDCWLGNGVILMANLPNHSIVAAGSVYVTEVDQPWTIVGGNPAKIIKVRHKETPNS
jgi:virginiamycin A acetyltransferase